MAKQKYIVIGLGEFGYNLAVNLVGKGMDVIAIDQSEERVNHIMEIVPHSIVADATKKPFLESLDITSSDYAIVSLGVTMEPSILCVLNLKEIGVKNIIVKAQNSDHYKILEKLGATTIVYPEKDMALRIAQTLTSRNIKDFLPIAEGFSIQQIDPPASFVTKTLKELDIRNKYNTQIIAVIRPEGGEVLFVPRSNYRIKKDDQLVILGKDSDISKIINKIEKNS